MFFKYDLERVIRKMENLKLHEIFMLPELDVNLPNCLQQHEAIVGKPTAITSAYGYF